MASSVFANPATGVTLSGSAASLAYPLTVTGAVIATSVRGTAVTFTGLPATPVEGMMVGVTDGSTATWGAALAGSGANHVLAYYNGSGWTVAGK